MSIHYLESHKFYVESHNDVLPMVYVVKSYETFADCNYMHIHLELVAGQNDMYSHEWLPAGRFDEDVQNDYIIWYFMQEGMDESLKANDYIVIDMEDIPHEVQAIINIKSNE